MLRFSANASKVRRGMPVLLFGVTMCRGEDRKMTEGGEGFSLPPAMSRESMSNPTIHIDLTAAFVRMLPISCPHIRPLPSLSADST